MLCLVYLVIFYPLCYLFLFVIVYHTGLSESAADNLMMTISGIDNSHSIVDRPATLSRPPSFSTYPDFSEGYHLPWTSSLGGRGRRSRLEERGLSGRRIDKDDRGLFSRGTERNNSRSTLGSFRRNLPGNYVVTSADTADDFFFHFWSKNSSEK